MNYVDIKDSDIKRDAVLFVRDQESTICTVVGTVTSKSGVDHVLVESASGGIYAITRSAILKKYVVKAKHSLKEGDLFRLDSTEMYFLYVDDNTVIRIGSNFKYSYYSSVSQASLHHYVTQVVDGRYSKIEVVRNIRDSFGVIVKKS